MLQILYQTLQTLCGSTQTSHCRCHTVLHRLHTADATQFYTDFMLWMPHCSTQSLHCGCHTVLHRVYTVDATLFCTEFTLVATQFYTEFTLQTPHSSTLWMPHCSAQILHCGCHTVLHRLLHCGCHTVLTDSTLWTPHSSTQS